MTKLERFIYAFALVAGVSGVAFLSIFIGDRKNNKEISSVLVKPLLKQISSTKNKQNLHVYSKDVDKFLDSYISAAYKNDVDAKKLKKAFGNSKLATFKDEDSLMAYLSAEESKIPATITEKAEKKIKSIDNKQKLNKVLKDIYIDKDNEVLPVLEEENLPLLKSLSSYNGSSSLKTLYNSSQTSVLTSDAIEETAIKSKKYYSNYKVKPGDSVWRISKKFGFSIKTFYKANPGIKGKVLKIGKVIRIYTHPDLSKSSKRKSKYKSRKYKAKGIYFQKYKVRKKDTLSKVAKKFRTSVAKLLKWNSLKSPKIRPGQRIKVPRRFRVKKKKTHRYLSIRLFGRPVSGRITSRFGYRRDPFNHRRRQLHAGLDFGGGMRTPIKSAADGVVIFAGRNGGYGNTVIIRHQYGYISLYAHMAKIKTKKDAIVRKGQLIGLMGRTGIVTAAHLHFEIRKWKKLVNPLYMIGRKLKIKIPLHKKKKLSV